MKNIVRIIVLFISYCLVFTSILYANEQLIRSTDKLSITKNPGYTINMHADRSIPISKIISLNSTVSEPVSFSVTDTKGFLFVSVSSDYTVNFSGGGISLSDIIQVLKIMSGNNYNSIFFDINNDGCLGFEELGSLLKQIKEKQLTKNSYIIKSNTDAFFSIDLLPGHFDDVKIDIVITDFLGYTVVKSFTVTRNYNNAPVFEDNQMFSINDHANLQTVLGIVGAYDIDGDPISYTITRVLPDTSQANTFIIDTATGQIKLNTVLNAKEVQLYTLTVSVFDGISRAHADVIVQVVDDNHQPVVSVEPLIIGDHATINTSLGRPLTVTDYDPNDPISYTITQIKPVSLTKLFRIDSDTGEIILNAPLNAKEVQLYTLTVSVFDGICSTSANLIVQIFDENFTPVITVESLEIGDHTKINTIIGQPLKVTDDDPNDPISFTITQIMPDSLTITFFINAQTGEIILNAPLNAKDVKLYTLTVSVCDGISCTTADVIVQIIDDNYPPVITVEPNLKLMNIPLTDEPLYDNFFLLKDDKYLNVLLMSNT